MSGVISWPQGGLTGREGERAEPAKGGPYAPGESATALLGEIAACVACAADLPDGPRPVLQLGDTARIVIISQAPGRIAHETGVPWNDASGDRLREWLGLPRNIFYDPARVAHVPIGFCYPGRYASGDLPPRRECARLWQQRVLACLPEDRLTVLVGRYAQEWHLPRDRALSLTQRVRAFAHSAEDVIPLPHPSWRVIGWMRRNPWFEAEMLPSLRQRVAEALAA